MPFGPRQVDRPDLDRARDRQVRAMGREPRHQRAQAGCRIGAKRLRPGCVRLMVAEQVRPHGLAERKQREVGVASAEPFGEIGQRREWKDGARRRHVEADGQGVAFADHPPCNPGLAAQDVSEARRQHHEAALEPASVPERDDLHLRAEVEVGDPAHREQPGGQVGAQGIDEVGIGGAVLGVPLPVREATEAHDPDGVGPRGAAAGGGAEAERLEQRHLRGAVLLRPEIVRVDGVGVDQRDPAALAGEAPGETGPGETGADHHDIEAIRLGRHGEEIRLVRDVFQTPGRTRIARSSQEKAFCVVFHHFRCGISSETSGNTAAKKQNYEIIWVIGSKMGIQVPRPSRRCITKSWAKLGNPS